MGGDPGREQCRDRQFTRCQKNGERSSGWLRYPVLRQGIGGACRSRQLGERGPCQDGREGDCESQFHLISVRREPSNPCHGGRRLDAPQRVVTYR